MSFDTRRLSRRAQGLLAGGAIPEYLQRHSEGLSDVFDAVVNPDGYIGLCEAENRLVAEMVRTMDSGSLAEPSAESRPDSAPNSH